MRLKKSKTNSLDKLVSSKETLKTAPRGATAGALSSSTKESRANMKSLKYLEKVQDLYNLTNDAALANKLGVSRSAICLYRRGQRIMDEETCLQVALALKLENPLMVLMAAGMDRARNGRKTLWKHFAKKMIKEDH